MNTESVLALLAGYQPSTTKEQQDQQKITEFVGREARFTDRATPYAHLTASAWITDESCHRAVLLHHAKLNIWVQPGGHIEPSDNSLLEASLREAKEETGLQSLKARSEQIFDLDIHHIPARKTEPEHLHMDIRFWFQSPGEELVLSSESHDLRWLAAEEIMALTSEESVLRMVRKSLI